VNKINPKKLLNSKWTAVQPREKEKHFLVSDIKFDVEGEVALCLLEAVISRREESIDWTALKNSEVWLQGWK
jgi:tryptophan-rich hypothetical protein